jgi:hypothetical protein
MGYPDPARAPSDAVTDVTVATLTPVSAIEPTPGTGYPESGLALMVTPTETQIGPTVTVSPSPAPDMTVPAPLPPTPSETPSPTPELITDATVTPIVRHLNELEPIASAASFRRSVEWSPDSRYILYRAYSQEEVARNPQFPSGDLYAYATEGSNTLCGQLSEPGAQRPYFWLSNELAYVNDARGLTTQQPCGDSIGISEERIFPEAPQSVPVVRNGGTQYAFLGETSAWLWDRTTNTVHTVIRSENVPYFGGFSWSPGGSYFANSTVHESYRDAQTAILDVQTGQILQTIEWVSTGGPGDPEPPIWLSETQFLLNTWNQGPLLVTVGGEVVPLAPQILGERMPQLNPQEGSGLPSLFIVDEESGDYHILFMPHAENVSASPLWLYHSETGEVEELPFTEASYPAISPNEEWLTLLRPREWGDAETPFRGNETLTRQVDPPGSEPHLAVPPQYHSPVWSSDWTKVFVRWETGPYWVENVEEGFAILSSANGAALQRWHTDLPDYLTLYPVWSPDGDSIAIVAAGGEGEQLFLIPAQP